MSHDLTNLKLEDARENGDILDYHLYEKGDDFYAVLYVDKSHGVSFRADSQDEVTKLAIDYLNQ